MNKETQEIIDSLGDLNKEFEGKTILNLGCFGFLGKLFTEYFLAVDAKVIGCDNFIVGLPDNKVDHPNFTFFNHDVCLPLFDKLHRFKEIDYAVVCCGIADPAAYMANPKATRDISYLGTDNVLQLARERNIKSTLLFSSSEIYGDIPDDQIPVKETYNGNLSTTSERAIYRESKRILETIAHDFNRSYGTNIKIVRPFNTYNRYMNLNDNRVLPSFMRNIVAGKDINVYSPGSEKRTFCYANDFIDGAIRILLSKDNTFDIYNCGNDSPEISMVDLANKVLDITGNTVKLNIIDPPEGYKSQTSRRCPNIDKIKKLGYVPKIQLEEGIERYYNWIRDQKYYNWVKENFEKK